MGCMDTSGGRKLFLCSATSWEGNSLFWCIYRHKASFLFCFYFSCGINNYCGCGTSIFRILRKLLVACRVKTRIRWYMLACIYLFNYPHTFSSMLFPSLVFSFFFFLNISIPLIWQVRHYYYRLVRRMNKLLGPELCLDAKNSKDTNAAMLRWYVGAIT